MASERKLIYANDLFTAMCNDHSINGANLARIRRHIEAAPAVDAVEVVHGRWLNAPTVAFTEECSVCGFCVSWDADGWLHKYNYCPSCGADMRERSNNEEVR